MRKTRLLAVAILGCLTVTAVAVYASLTNGVFDIAVIDIIKTLLRINPEYNYDLVIFEFRLPRIIIGCLVGFGLGVAGAAIQGVTRNPLADPEILGISSGAGMAVVLYMLVIHGQMTGAGWMAMMTMPLFGVIGGVIAMALIYLFSRQNGILDPQRLILVGIAIGSGFKALTMFISLKMNPQDFEMATVWLAGSIYNASWKSIVTTLPWIVCLTPILCSKGHVLNLFQLHDASVRGLGVQLEKERNILLLSAAGIVSACVSVSGSIAFVGLIAPHIAARLIGLNYRKILPLSGFVGMAIVVAADFIGKTVFAPAELSVGIVISIIGVPYFIYLLLRR